MIQDSEEDNHKYQDNNCIISMFVEQSQNCEILVGKVSLIPKKQIPLQTLYIKLMGFYIVAKNQKTQMTESHAREDSHFHLTTNQYDDKQHKIDSFQDFSIDNTNRYQKKNVNASEIKSLVKNKQYTSELYKEETEGKIKQCFLEGKQKIAQLEEKQYLEEWQAIHYPFTFTLPGQIPESIDDITFGNRKISIKYEIQISNSKNKNKQIFIQGCFPIKIRQPASLQKASKISNFYQFRCFGKFFCRCLGVYHLQLQSNILTTGKLRVHARVFCEGKSTQKIINSLNVNLFGQLKGVTKFLMSKKQIKLNDTEFEMKEGEIIIDYEKELKTYSNQLFTIRFWIEPDISFDPSLWVFLKNKQFFDIIL